MKFYIETIDHNEQAYPTVGNWYNGKLWGEDGGEVSVWSRHQAPFDTEKDTLIIRVSNVGDWRMEALVGIHELVEAILCIDKDITQKSVDEFDIAFEKARKEADLEGVYAADGSRDDAHNFYFVGEILEMDAEPGDHPVAPYHIQHGYATAVERMLCAAMNIPWATYESRLKELDG